MVRTFHDILEDARRRTPALSLEDLRARIDAGEAVTLVDVREGEEFRAGHLPNALHVPRAQLERDIEFVAPDRDRPVVLYCASGARAALAAATLRDMGYTRVARAEPGFVRWKELGFPVALPRALTEAQRARYTRHLSLPEVGEAGQRALLDARVLCLGAGGLGSPALLYLAAAGVGTLGVVDDDAVDVSNLQRQVLHTTARVGAPKVESAEATLRALNPDVRVETFRERLTRDNAERLVAGFDVIVDGSDNFATRYALNDAAVRARKPVVHGAIQGFEGQVTTLVPFAGPCYRCIYPVPPAPGLAPACGVAGVLGVLPGVIGVLQATEAIKLVLRRGESLAGRVLIYDALAMAFHELHAARDPACPACGDAHDGEVADPAGLCAGPT
jgi:molybdopterin/thiamine biosynthesis adenylyltransferase/rhodanese-related sulfurtransferase